MCVCVCICTHIHTHTYIYIYIYIYIYLHAHTNTYMHTYICTYIHTYIHTRISFNDENVLWTRKNVSRWRSLILDEAVIQHSLTPLGHGCLVVNIWRKVLGLGNSNEPIPNPSKFKTVFFFFCVPKSRQNCLFHNKSTTCISFYLNNAGQLSKQYEEIYLGTSEIFVMVRKLINTFCKCSLRIVG